MSLDRQLDFLAPLLTPRAATPATPVPPAVSPTPAVPPTPAVSLPKPPTGTQLEARARELLAGMRCEALSAQLRVRWNTRMRSTAGTAYPGKSLITLNPRLLQFGEAEVDRTLRHELAHLLAHFRAGRRRIAAHGPEWKQACVDLGLVDETRCHTLPLPRRQMQARHHYRCAGCGQDLKRVRPLRRKTACLACCKKHNGGRYDERFRFVKITN